MSENEAKWGWRFALFPTRVGVGEDGKVKRAWLVPYKVRKREGLVDIFFVVRKPWRPTPGVEPIYIGVNLFA